MRYVTYTPCESLKAYIREFALSEAEEEQSYTVLPGTGLVLGFQYKGRLSLVLPGAVQMLSTSGLTGLHDRYRVFRNTAHIGTLLVYFKEGAAASFFKEPIHELYRESLSLDHFLVKSELMVLEEQLYEAVDDLSKIKVMERFLMARLRPMRQDLLVVKALSLIQASKGLLRISDLAQQLHISVSPLEKRFRSMVGASPKKFSSIVRLNHAISHYNPCQPLSDVYFDAGYYDQAHFIKEFKVFTGQTPESFFKTRNVGF